MWSNAYNRRSFVYQKHYNLNKIQKVQATRYAEFHYTLKILLHVIKLIFKEWPLFLIQHKILAYCIVLRSVCLLILIVYLGNTIPSLPLELWAYLDMIDCGRWNKQKLYAKDTMRHQTLNICCKHFLIEQNYVFNKDPPMEGHQLKYLFRDWTMLRENKIPLFHTPS